MARLITLGHGYVQVGEKVQVAEEETTGGSHMPDASAQLATGSVIEPTAAQ